MKKYSLTQLFTLKNLESSWKEVGNKLNNAPFRDVIDYRDYHFFITQKVKRLRHEILSVRYRPAPSVYVRSQRSKGMNRVLTYFHPADLIVYNLICKLIHFAAKSHYKKNAFFSRTLNEKKNGKLIRTEGEFFFEPYGGTYNEWKKFSDHRAGLGTKLNCNYAVLADITNFFEHIHHATVRDTVFPYIRNRELVNLLLLILEDNILRPKYSSHLRLGIPQDSFDCSRVIANLLLLKVDRLIDKRTHGQWNRWMDDITFCVKTEEEGQHIIRDIWEMLREDGLSLNSSKTKIMTRRDLKSHLLIVENALLDSLSEKIKRGHLKSCLNSLKSLWHRLKNDQKPLYWEKVVSRILNIAGRLSNPFLLKEIPWLLRNYPKLYVSICTYLESIPYRKKVLEIINDFIGSGYDLYEEVQVGIMETLPNLNIPKKQRNIALGIAWKVFNQKKYLRQEYSRSSSVLVLFAFGDCRTFAGLLKRYNSPNVINFSEVVRRYMAGVLLASDLKFHEEVLKGGIYETNQLLKDLILFAAESKMRGAWDKKTKAAFCPNKIGFSGIRTIGIRKVILLGILTHHPDQNLRKQLTRIALNELNSIGVIEPRKNNRTDELIFQMIAKRGES